MNFYYNVEANICAEEDYVIAKLIEAEEFDNEPEAFDALMTEWNVAGWVKCDVTATIEDAVSGNFPPMGY